MEGQIKRVNFDRGFGFVSNGNGGKDVFFHVSQVRGGDEVFKSLQVGDRVSFEVEDDRSSSSKGPRAINLQLC